MKHLALAVFLATPFAAPAVAQDGDGLSEMSRGFRQFMDGVQKEMEPALRDLQGMAESTAPYLRQLQDRLGETVDDLDAYAAPEIQPNGDILIRRKEPLSPDGAAPPDGEPAADGSIDL